eukprot:10660259-Lingulodinium_polyedra.AAC.1
MAIGTPTLPVPGPEPRPPGRRAARLVRRPRVAKFDGLTCSGHCHAPCWSGCCSAEAARVAELWTSSSLACSGRLLPCCWS